MELFIQKVKKKMKIFHRKKKIPKLEIWICRNCCFPSWYYQKTLVNALENVINVVFVERIENQEKVLHSLKYVFNGKEFYGFVVPPNSHRLYPTKNDIIDNFIIGKYKYIFSP